jgi:hypothetical protein
LNITPPALPLNNLKNTSFENKVKNVIRDCHLVYNFISESSFYF